MHLNKPRTKIPSKLYSVIDTIFTHQWRLHTAPSPSTEYWKVHQMLDSFIFYLHLPVHISLSNGSLLAWCQFIYLSDLVYIYDGKWCHLKHMLLRSKIYLCSKTDKSFTRRKKSALQMEKKLTASQEGVTLSIQEQGECQNHMHRFKLDKSYL